MATDRKKWSHCQGKSSFQHASPQYLQSVEYNLSVELQVGRNSVFIVVFLRLNALCFCLFGESATGDKRKSTRIITKVQMN